MAPSSDEIKQMFEPLSVQGQQQEFFNHVADDVNWTILGHSPMSRVYNSKQEFIEATLTYLRERVLKEPLRLEVVNVVGGGDSDWAMVEMTAIDAECKNGLKYDMNYCWTFKFNEKKIMTHVRAYLDTKLLTDAIEQNR